MAKVHDRLLATYLRHLEARIRSITNRADAGDEDLTTLPAELTELSAKDPRQCLAFAVRALDEASSPAFVSAIGSGLLEILLNSNAAALRTDIAHQLQTNRKFRRAFANGHYSSVATDLMNEWVAILQDVTTMGRT